MSLSGFIARLKRYDENAKVIFDRAEPIGRATDLVMPRRRWFRRDRKQNLLSAKAGAAPARS